MKPITRHAAAIGLLAIGLLGAVSRGAHSHGALLRGDPGNVAPVHSDERLEFFESRIRPILAEHCYECHGPQVAESELRLDHGSFLFAEGAYGTVVVAGEARESALFLSLTHKDDSLLMPFEQDKLPEGVVEDFRKWIEDGAFWPDEPVPGDVVEHFDLQSRIDRLPWIWTTPEKTEIPIVTHEPWVTNEIDSFILAKLEGEGLSPAPDAAPEVWLRRVYFAITGLPPTREQVEEFLHDTSDENRERVVNRLLESPHFGEKWARHWMDLVRYAESRGHESDFIIANAWHYRDYLIRAYNADLPYDEFVIEHLAGDLLEKPRLNGDAGFNESVLATAWPFFGEEVHSPVDIRQDECDRLDNKVDVLSKTFLGLTVACARCHDHKFDALSQADYYALSGYLLSSHFRQVRFETMNANRVVAQKLESLETSTKQELAEQIARGLDPVRANLHEHLVAALAETSNCDSMHTGDEIDSDLVGRWQLELREAQQDGSHPLYASLTGRGEQETDVERRSQEETRQQDLVRSDSTSPRIIDYSDPECDWRASGYAFGQSKHAIGDIIIPIDATQGTVSIATEGFARRDPIWNELSLHPENENDSGKLNAVSRSSGMLLTKTFVIGDGRIHISMQGACQIYAAVDSHLMITGPLHQKLVSDHKSAERNWMVLDLSEYRGHRVHLEIGTIGQEPLTIWQVLEGPPPSPLPADVIETEPLSPSPQECANAIVGEYVLALERLTKGELEQFPESARLLNWSLAHQDLFPGLDQIDETSQAILKSYWLKQADVAKEIQTSSHTAVSLIDGSGVDEYLLKRGKSSAPGPPVRRGLPEAMGFELTPNDVESGRLELALRLTDPKNPLVARVMVNRVWHHLYGRGIIATVDNFGWLGQRPTHPELLDYLAYQFVHEDEWSIKKLIKRMVLSRTFGMSSRPDNEHAEEVDPTNLLYHRMSVRRLEAEAIRDNLLAISGRLDRTQFGRSIPVHLTEFVVGRGRPGTSGPLDGAGRRSIYISVRRNFLPTMMLTFDMPIPFSTVGRRNVTNVPAQSLALMNDKLVFELASTWAERLIADMPDASAEERVVHMYWSSVGRPPTDEEVRVTLATLDALAQHRGVPNTHLHVWADLCHAFFQLNEFIYLR